MLRRLFIASGLFAVGSFIQACSGAEPGAATGTTTESAVTPRDGPKPPQEAIDACANANKGAACSLSFDGHAFTGTCRNGPDGDGPLACAPPHPPPGARMGPPKEAVDACASSSSGSACNVSLGGTDHAGTCRNGPEGQGPLACAPNDLPPPP